MAKRLTIHRDNNPIYDIVIKNSFEDMKDEFVRLNLQGRKYALFLILLLLRSILIRLK